MGKLNKKIALGICVTATVMSIGIISQEKNNRVETEMDYRDPIVTYVDGSTLNTETGYAYFKPVTYYTAPAGYKLIGTGSNTKCVRDVVKESSDTNINPLLATEILLALGSGLVIATNKNNELQDDLEHNEDILKLRM